MRWLVLPAPVLSLSAGGSHGLLGCRRRCGRCLVGSGSPHLDWWVLLMWAVVAVFAAFVAFHFFADWFAGEAAVA